MSVPERKTDVYERFLAVPDTKVAEIIDGELIVSPRPAIPHAVCASFIGEELGPPFKRGRGGPGGWWILFEPELHLDDHILVPDLAGWRRERMPVCPDAAFITLPPDWVCEVISESSRRTDRIRKLPIYAEHEVKHVWLIDPAPRTLEVLRLENGRWVLLGTYADDAKVRAEPFDAIELELAFLWDRGEGTGTAAPAVT